jgi:formate dehydrogenase iron-sulfur subunit
MLACPWWIPKYEWDKVFPAVSKCRYCVDLLENGREPACAKSCPSAIDFGDREDMLTLARKRIAANPGKYINHIYGEREVGGTNVLYLSDVPFEKLGLSTSLPYNPYPQLTWNALKKVPALAIGVGASMTAIYMLTHRKEQVLKAQENNIEKAGE